MINLAPSTASVYISAIRSRRLMEEGLQIGNNFLLSRLLKGYAREFATHSQSVVKLPITINLLTQMITSLPHVTMSSHETILYTAMFSVAFFGLMRIGEITSSAHSLLVNNVHFIPSKNSYNLSLTTSKTQQVFKGYAQNVTLTQHPSQIICPVSNLSRYLTWRPQTSDPSLFVHGGGGPVSRASFSAMMLKALQVANVQTSSYSTHSFRSGGATELFMNGASEQQIKNQGRWKSDAYKTYVRPF